MKNIFIFWYVKYMKLTSKNVKNKTQVCVFWDKVKITNFMEAYSTDTVQLKCFGHIAYDWGLFSRGSLNFKTSAFL